MLVFINFSQVGCAIATHHAAAHETRELESDRKRRMVEREKHKENKDKERTKEKLTQKGKKMHVLGRQIQISKKNLQQPHQVQVSQLL